jgi:hypothetical protein
LFTRAFHLWAPLRVFLRQEASVFSHIPIALQACFGVKPVAASTPWVVGNTPQPFFN